jgi:hypothetical protein
MPPPLVDGAEDAGEAGDPLDPPELQAAARTAAAARGPPTLIANEAFLDVSRLFIWCAFPFGGISCYLVLPSIAQTRCCGTRGSADAVCAASPFGKENGLRPGSGGLHHVNHSR